MVFFQLIFKFIVKKLEQILLAKTKVMIILFELKYLTIRETIIGQVKIKKVPLVTQRGSSLLKPALFHGQIANH